MNDDEAAEPEPEPAAAKLCARARETLGTSGSFRARVLLDMLLIELNKGSSDEVSSPRSDSPDES